MEKQTAVQYAIDFLRKNGFDNEATAIELTCLPLEKQQIVDANIAGMEFIPVDPNRYMEDAEQYFTETFKTKEVK